MQDERQSASGIYYRFGKRLFDLSLALLVSIVFALPMIFISLMYLFIPGAKPFFIQERIGRKEQTFRLIKFRTLNRDENRTLQERRFWFGDFLRFTNLDELPQLYNIVIGDMSWIGPRPLPVEYLSLYSEVQRTRHTVRPGITGWAQVNGRHSISWQQKFAFDVFYAKNVTFVLDLRIIFKTIVLLLSFQEDHSLHEKKFTGNNDE